MPHPPETNPSIAAISESLFSEMTGQLSKFPGETYPLYVGDTWLQPPEGCRMEDLSVSEYPNMYRYPPAQGIPDLLSAISQRMNARGARNVAVENVIVTAGGTGAISSIVGAILSPGEELLVLAPYWPLITGIARSFSAVPVPVPFYSLVDSPETAVDAVSAYRTSRTAALYINSPNNPTGHVLPRSWLEALIEWAEKHGLWIISDEVYEDYIYQGTHTCCYSISPERTFSVYSFSKAFGMAGNRCGYAIGAAQAIKQVQKVNTHTAYSAPAPAQIAGCRILRGVGDKWVDTARRQYQKSGQEVAALLGVEPPQGGNYIFMDISEHLDQTGTQGFFNTCMQRGLLVAPGTFFGDFPTHIRICFTSAAPEIVQRGVMVLADILQR